MVDGLLEQHPDVGIVQGIDDPVPVPLADDQAQMTEKAKLMRDGGLRHPDGLSESRDGAGCLAQTREDADPARRGERLHHLGDLVCRVGIDLRWPAPALSPVTHFAEHICIDVHTRIGRRLEPGVFDMRVGFRLASLLVDLAAVLLAGAFAGALALPGLRKGLRAGRRFCDECGRLILLGERTCDCLFRTRRS